MTHDAANEVTHIDSFPAWYHVLGAEFFDDARNMNKYGRLCFSTLGLVRGA